VHDLRGIKVGGGFKMKAFLVLALLFVSFVSGVYASDGSEYWSTATVSVKINDRVKINLVEQLRFQNDMGNMYTYVQYFGPSYKVSDYLDIGLWHKLVAAKSNGRWSESNRFDFDGTLKLELFGFNFSNRSRFERNVDSPSWLYRDRIKITKKIKLFNRDFTPFVSNEFFFNLEPTDGYGENRAIVGISTAFLCGSKLTLSYMSRTKKANGNWSNANVLGTSIGFSF